MISESFPCIIASSLIKSFDNFIQNNFAPTVKEEISDLIIALGWEEKYGLPIDFVPIEMTQKGLR